MESLVPNQSLVDMDMSSVPPILGPAALSNPSGQEPTIVTSVSGLAPPHIPTAHPTSQVSAILQSGSPISISEDMVPNNENFKETIPIFCVMTQSVGPFGGAAANVGILHGVASAVSAGSQTTPVMSQGFLPGSQLMQSGVGMHQNVPSEMDTSMYLGQLLSNIQGGIEAGSLTTSGMAQGNLSVSQMMQSGIDMHQNVPSGMGTSVPSGQLLSNIQGCIAAGTLTTPVNLHRSQLMPSGIGMHQNVPSGMGIGMPSEIGTMMPTPVMTQQGQPEILPVGRNNSAEANMSLSQQQTLATSLSAQSGFVNIWEGNLSLVRWGEPEHISRLQGYKKSSASESLAANFPQTLQILCIIPKALMMKLVKQHTGKAETLAFWAIDSHAILNALQEMNFGVLISLPPKTLFVYVSDKTNRLLGLLVPHEYVPVMLTTPNQQLQAWTPHQLQQLQGQLLYEGQQPQEQPFSQVQQLQGQSLSEVQQLQEQSLSEVQLLQEQPFSQVDQPQLLPQVQQLRGQPLSQVQQLQEQPLPQLQQEQPLSQVQQLPEQPLSLAQLMQAQLIPDVNWDYDDFQALHSFLDD